ncbi:MAPEG family protein [Nereida ignava]|uniref:MAPEG family protein n=1 Tax=Nereida ignava TaxID=282199 RepID=UPI002FE13433
MDLLSLQNPVFLVYTVAASLMVLKVMGQGWMTVYRMLKVNGGWASPEDLRPGMINKDPNASQLDANDYVERSRRMHRNDLENIPAFWISGFLFVLAEPSLILAQVLLYGFVVARLMHSTAYATQRSHELRATFYTLGSVIVVLMALYTLSVVLN